MNFEASPSALKNTIGKEAMRFQFLLESDRLSGAEKDLYQRLIKIGTSSEVVYDITDAALTDSLKTLSQLLETHYGQKMTACTLLYLPGVCGSPKKAFSQD